MPIVAAITIAQTKRPVSGKSIGWRIKVANYNNARFDVLSQEYCQSYAPKYLIAESGDYTEYPGKKTVEAFLAGLRMFHRIDEFIPR